MYVVPFVAKVLESCAKSRVFKPPSPWTMGIMNLLSELHQEHDLKLNLKFEIEVLCKTLSIELSSLTPGNLLSQVVQIRSFGLKSQTPPATNQVAKVFFKEGWTLKLSLLLQKSASTWGPQTINRISQAEKNRNCVFIPLIIYLNCDIIRHLLVNLVCFP